MLERLASIGFRRAGHWELANGVLRLVLPPPLPASQDLLYAFAVAGELAYVGKTTQGLVRRLQGYRSPPTSADRGGSTNIKNHRHIVAALGRGDSVDVYVLDSLPAQQHGGFAVSLAAGLEDALIRELVPPWNGLRSPATNRPKVPPADCGAVMLVPVPVQQVMSPQSTRGGEMVPSVDDLFAFCRSLPTATWTTSVRRNLFTVEVDGNALAITPSSSRAARREARESVKVVLERLARTGSYRMSDYQDVSFNASYLLALVQAWQRQQSSIAIHG